MQLLSESFREPCRFHVTIPFASEIEMLSRSNASVEDAMCTMTANMFSEIMSDYMPNPEQNAETGGAEITSQSNAWPPLKVTDYSLDEWPNSNIRPTCEQNTTNEAITQASDVATPAASPLTPVTRWDPRIGQ